MIGVALSETVIVQRVIVQPSQIQGSILTLTPDQLHYLQRVLRLRSGDYFMVLDGQGQSWVAVLQAGTGQADLREARSDPLALPTLTLAAALPKQGFDDVVRQVTELGVSRIVPILSDRTLLQPSPQKLQRWQRIATEAAEQSERPLVPQIESPQSWPDWLAQSPTSDHRWLCVARRNSPPLLSRLLATGLPITPESTLTLATGPEGGWTETEVESAIAQGYLPISLGPTILRAVTAPITAIAVIQAAIQFAKMGQHL
ncbi:16S rRNA (uracil(1498)-N(3))-methyltransferase [Leptolyngbya sp. PCC 6406]|uniref:16S rRNA (uracil(1498)-N(3))-methyltransferase n=1 Tax=Leptolyngbya sp. PCC 6406 TaxID=1173264 RepID=UPI0002ACABF6|nr:16S rRNA (uracil(1498)-N(3))-methyltransferase [Leptolyngbya sp. PCC 6406]